MTLLSSKPFFCAIHPSMRPQYVQQMKKILKPGGKLVGLLFDFPLESGPPFGGSYEEYKGHFQPHFHIKTLGTCV